MKTIEFPKVRMNITIDQDIYFDIRRRQINISALLNDYLISYFRLEDTLSSQPETVLRERLEKLRSERSEITKEEIAIGIKLTSLERIREDKQKELQEKEKNKRWVCAVCSVKVPPIRTLNFMDVIRCKACNLGKISDSKTVFVYAGEGECV